MPTVNALEREGAATREFSAFPAEGPAGRRDVAAVLGLLSSYGGQDSVVVQSVSARVSPTDRAVVPVTDRTSDSESRNKVVCEF